MHPFIFFFLDCTVYTTDRVYWYRYQFDELTNNRIEFDVKASSDVHISLSSSNANQDHMYEIVLGGWRNSKSVIRRCIQCKILASKMTHTAGMSVCLFDIQVNSIQIKNKNKCR